MKCSSLMKADVECCRVDATVEEAAERMKKRNIGFMPVCAEGGAVIGTVTDRDLAIRVLGERRDAPFTLVEEVMTPEVVSCSPDDELEVAERLMEQYRKSRIVCVDDRSRPVGVISLSDIALVEKGVRAAEILQAVVAREAQVRVA